MGTIHLKRHGTSEHDASDAIEALRLSLIHI